MYYLAFGGADGLQKPGDDAVRTEQLNGALVDGVEDFLGGGFTCEQGLELGHYDLVHDGLGVGCLLNGNAGRRSDDETDLTGCACSVARIDALGADVSVAAGLADGVEEQSGVNSGDALTGAEVIHDEADVLEVLVGGVVIAQSDETVDSAEAGLSHAVHSGHGEEDVAQGDGVLNGGAVIGLESGVVLVDVVLERGIALPKIMVLPCWHMTMR